MAENWYPIINYEKCTRCFACVKFCPHDVLKEKNGRPVVANPKNCVEFCRGCQKGACDSNAIKYFGDKEVGKNG